MFEPFRQADNAPTRRYSGSGLGLYIVKHFLERIGGSVTMESEVGRGSTFRVWLPGVAIANGQKTSNLPSRLAQGSQAFVG